MGQSVLLERLSQIPKETNPALLEHAQQPPLWQYLCPPKEKGRRAHPGPQRT